MRAADERHHRVLIAVCTLFSLAGRDGIMKSIVPVSPKIQSAYPTGDGEEVVAEAPLGRRSSPG
jgi:hypothetical protein